MEEIGCKKSAIESGCVYNDGSFSLVTDGLLTQRNCDFEFMIDGKKIHGTHTGLLAYRKDKFAFATAGSELYIDEKKICLDFI